MNPFDPGYFTESELKDAGFKSIGKNVLIAKNTTIVGLDKIEIGSNVRIDGFSTLVASGTGWLKIGSYVHISGYCYLSAGEGIRMDDFSGLSQGVKVYTRTDDYAGTYLTNPTVPEELTGGARGPVTLEKHVIVGSGCVILPDITIGEGSSVGALSLVSGNLEPWGIFLGTPAKRHKARSRKLLQLEARLRQTTE